jgi:hypothetical protein
MVYLDVYKGASEAAREMGLNSQSAKQRITYYFEKIRDSEDLQRAVLLKHANLISERGGGAAGSASTPATADKASYYGHAGVDQDAFNEALVAVAEMYRDKDPRACSLRKAAVQALSLYGVEISYSQVRRCVENSCKAFGSPGRVKGVKGLGLRG